MMHLSAKGLKTSPRLAKIPGSRRGRRLPHQGERCWRRRLEGLKPWKGLFVAAPLFRARLHDKLTGTSRPSEHFGFRMTSTKS